MKRLIFLKLALLSGCAAMHYPTREVPAPGIIYENLEQNKTIVHIANIDPAHAHLRLVKAAGSPSLEKVSSLASQHDAIIATNAGFFQKNGQPAGALKIDGHWLKKPALHRGLVGFRSDLSEIKFDRAIAGDNNNLKSAFFDSTWWDSMPNVLGGAPLLIFNGEKQDFSQERTQSSFLNNRYARTALCETSEKHLKFIVVEGSDRLATKIGFKSGMSIDELADFLINLGCLYALNLDGGYSSVFIKNKQKMSSFALSWLGERAVSSALVVQKKN